MVCVYGVGLEEVFNSKISSSGMQVIQTPCPELVRISEGVFRCTILNQSEVWAVYHYIGHTY